MKLRREKAVIEFKGGRPVAVRLRGRSLPLEVLDWWREAGEWWRGEREAEFMRARVGGGIYILRRSCLPDAPPILPDRLARRAAARPGAADADAAELGGLFAGQPCRPGREAEEEWEVHALED